MSENIDELNQIKLDYVVDCSGNLQVTAEEVDFAMATRLLASWCFLTIAQQNQTASGSVLQQQKKQSMFKIKLYRMKIMKVLSQIRASDFI